MRYLCLRRLFLLLLNIFKANLRKKQRNPRISVRGAALKIGVSPGTLSRCLNGERKISIELGQKLSEWFDLCSSESEYFRNLILLESVQSESLKSELRRVLNYSFVGHTETSKHFRDNIDELLDNTTLKSCYSYIDPKTGDQRFLNLLEEVKTKTAINSFYDYFISPKRSVSSIGYFIKNDNQAYSCYLDLLSTSVQQIHMIDTFRPFGNKVFKR